MSPPTNHPPSRSQSWMARFKAFWAVLAFLTVAMTQAQASHFRYGTVSWAPTANPGEVKFTIVDAFRRSAYSGTAPDGMPAVGDFIVENTGATSFNYGDGGNTGVLQYVVTAIDPDENFLVGEAVNPGTTSRGVLHTYVGAGPFTAAINSSSRVAALNNRSNGTYRLETFVYPTGTNRSPVTSLAPVLNVPVGPAVTFFVPATDPDGDGLRWRLSTDAEAGGGPSPTNLSIDPNTGKVTWNNVGLDTVNAWTAQVVIEDLDTNGIVKSKTPVDFILEINTAAGVAPTVTINPAGPLSVAPGNPVSFTVTGADADAGSTVSLNTSGLPAGATMNPVLPLDGDGSGTSSTFNWTPGVNQSGSYPISFSVTDNTGKQTSGSINITVSNVPAPIAVTGLASPVSQTGATLNGTANPSGYPASARFEYGTDITYGNATAPQSIGTGTSAVPVSAVLAGLNLNTVYHFRIVSSNAGGTSVGDDQTFTTANLTPPPVAFVTPASGAVFSGASNAVQVDGTDAANLPTSVTFYIDTPSTGSTLLSTDNSAPFTTTFSVVGLPPGESVKITAVATGSAPSPSTISVTGSVAYPAVTEVLTNDAVTATTGGTRLYPLANDSINGSVLKLISVSNPLITISADGRSLIVPEHFTGSFTYQAFGGGLVGQSTVNVLGGSPLNAPTLFNGLLVDSNGKIAGWAKATISTKGFATVSIRLGTASAAGKFAFPKTGTTGSGTTTLGAVTITRNLDGTATLSLTPGGVSASALVNNTYTGTLRAGPKTATAVKYHVALASIDAAIPGGGFAVANVKRTGLVSVAGLLPDGRPFSTSSTLGDNGTIAFFAVESKGVLPPALLGGELIAANLATTDVTGELVWHKPAQSSGAKGQHLGGLDTILTANGSIYNGVIPLTGPGTLVLSGGNLAATESNAVTVVAGIPGTPKASLLAWAGVKASVGKFRTKVKVPVGKPVTGGGIYLPKSNSAWGYFPGTTLGGRISLTVTNL